MVAISRCLADASTNLRWGYGMGRASRPKCRGFILWIIQRWCDSTNQWLEEAREAPDAICLALVKLTEPYALSDSNVISLIRGEILGRRKLLLEVVLTSVVINAVGLAVAMYTLLVYDRVVPMGASQTLLVLSLGVAIAIVYEFITKHVRSRLFEQLIKEMDQSLAGVTTHVLVDAPFSLLFMGVMFLIGGYLAVIPLLFFCLCIALGFYYKGRVAALAVSADGAFCPVGWRAP